ncbi:MAG: carboxypeptidase-like regulatory domain-containing protein, partial [Bacteroidia bacterium]|nr:carboxypeptidase-like regulatory domain-containing protein [Bacteroidia bacterium]
MISGIITDSLSNEPLIGASVQLKGATVGTYTDDLGKFKLTVTGNPPYTLLISYVGYNAKEIKVKEMSKPIVITLSEVGTMGKEVEIIDSRITEKQKQSPLTVETMDVIAIKETPATNFYEGLGQLKGVDLTSASLAFKIVNTRGFNSTRPVRSLQLIDGMDNQAPGLNFSLGNFVGASELDLQSVDLVVGASSAIYGPNAFNGVINMTTKSPFIHRGLSVMVKGGERWLVDAAVRYAKVFKI